MKNSEDFTVVNTKDYEDLKVYMKRYIELLDLCYKFVFLGDMTEVEFADKFEEF